jgi:transcriptional regulator with XRE-family HTH domain
MAVESTAAPSPGTLTGRSVAPRATAVAVPALQHWRVTRAMLQRELAQAAEVDLRTIQRLEAGGRAGLDTVRRLAEALHVEPAELMSQPPEK